MSNQKGFHIPADPKRIEREARDERIKQRKANPKTNPTNREVMDAVNDLADLMMDVRDTR